MTNNIKSESNMYILYVNNSHFELLLQREDINFKSVENIISEYKKDEEFYEKNKKKKQDIELKSLKELLNGYNDNEVLNLFCDQIIGNLD
jgi:iron uptake system EfeUOB component EfeO/EfeM